MTGIERKENDNAIIERLLKVITESNLSYSEAHDILKRTIYRIGDTKLVFSK